MKKRPIAGTMERCTDSSNSFGQNVPLPSFEIQNLQKVTFNSKRGLFEVVFLEGRLVVGAELFAPPNREVFVQPASIRNRYSGNYERTVRWSEDLTEAILAAVLALYEDSDT